MTEDIYANTASEVFGVPVGEVTESQRRFAKVLCFGKGYGGDAGSRILDAARQSEPVVVRDK